MPIVNLLQTEAMKNIAHQSGPYKDQKINLTNIVEVMKPAYDDYCARMPGANCHIGCDRRLNFHHNDIDYFLTLQSFPFNEHVVYCAQDEHCLYFAQGKWQLIHF